MTIFISPAATATPCCEIRLADFATESAIVARTPSIRDIDAAYDEIDLTFAQVDALQAQRAARMARPTVPLTRLARP